jgi:hypothetical protein
MLIPRINPRATTIMAAARWILELCSKISKDLRPLNANLKLLNLDRGVNLPEFMCRDLHLKTSQFGIRKF